MPANATIDFNRRFPKFFCSRSCVLLAEARCDAMACGVVNGCISVEVEDCSSKHVQVDRCKDKIAPTGLAALRRVLMLACTEAPARVTQRIVRDPHLVPCIAHEV